MAPISKANLDKECFGVALSTGEMFNWTRFALLAQYHILCNDRELMKLQLNHLGLVFEWFPVSHDSQAICAHGFSHGGHVSLRGLTRFSTQILEHSLLQYHQVKDTLYPRNFFENRFWNNISMEPNWGDPGPVKKKVEAAIDYLAERYDALKMFGDQNSMNAIGFENVKLTFATTLGIVVVLSIRFIVIEYCRGRKNRRIVIRCSPMEMIAKDRTKWFTRRLRNPSILSQRD